MILPPQWRPGKLAVRLAAYVILFSSAIAVVITAVELGSEYIRDLRGIDGRMQQIQDAYLDSIVENVWVTDRERIDTMLLGITRLPDFVMAEVRVGGRTLIRRGRDLTEQGTTQVFPLQRMHRGRMQAIGELVVAASYENAFRRVLDRLLFFLAANGAKTFLVAIFIFVIFYRLVGRPVEQIARYTRDFSPDRPLAPMRLDRPGAGSGDELAQVEDAYNQMARRLAESYESLRQANVILEKGVAQRTGELEQAKARVESDAGRLQDAIEAVSAGFAMFDSEERLVLYNEAYRRINGKVAHLLVPGSKFEDLLRAMVKAETIRDIPGDVESWIQWRLDRFRNPQGPWEVVTDAGTIHQIHDLATRSGGRIVLRTDVTALKRSEKELAGVQARLQDAIESITPGVILFDKDEKIVAFNENFRQAVLPLAARLKIGTTFEDWINYIAAHGHYGEVDPGFAAERIRRFRALESVEFMERGLDGREHRILARHYRTRDGGTFIFREDITVQKQMEEHLRHAQRLESLGNMAGGVAHSLNNLLLPILALSKMTADGMRPSDPARVALEKVVEASERARDLVARILAFSRKETPRKEEADLRAVVADALHLARPSLHSAIRLESAPAPRAMTAMIDTPQIEAAILNLIANAAAAIGDRADGRIAVGLAAHKLDSEATRRRGDLRPGDYGVITVEDNGAGMDAATKARIFDPFFTTKKVGEGTGLGLSMAHGIVGEHGGAIEVESELGKGTVFRIFLPLLAVGAPPRQNRLPASPVLNRE